MGLVTLTTDFGAADSYVGQMKGAILTVAPGVRIVDLCHQVPPHDVVAGAWHLETGASAFPAGTVHVAIVDPGVGTDRAAIVAVSDRYVFVGPDNGVLSRALRRHPPRAVYRLPAADPERPDAATTFEGRDRFAPAAARIAAGASPATLGSPTETFVRLTACEAIPRPGAPVEVPVIAVDRFGNTVLDLDRERLAAGLGEPPEGGSQRVRVTTPRGVVSELRTSYAGGGDGFLIVNSAGYLEIARDRGRADRHHELRPGAIVLVAVL